MALELSVGNYDLFSQLAIRAELISVRVVSKDIAPMIWSHDFIMERTRTMFQLLLFKLVVVN